MKVITSGGQTTEIPEAIKMCNNTHSCSFKSLFLNVQKKIKKTTHFLNVKTMTLIFVLQTLY